MSLAVLSRAAAQEIPAFRSEVNLVNVAAVVRSTDGALLSNLSRNDFEVLEDGVPQTLQFFARNTELPLSLGIVVDVSGSQQKFLKQHDRDIAAFLRAVLRPSDQAFAICFGNHLRLVSDATGSEFTILEGLKQFSQGDRDFPEIGPKENRDLGTAFYDALYFSMQDKLKSAGERRRALVVFSDGEENSSEHDLLDVIEAAQNTGTMVYCVRYTEEKHHTMTARNKYGIRVMRHISNLTGATDFDALTSDLADIFSRIGDDLRATYQIGYVSSNTAHDGLFRKLTVRVKKPGSSVRAKAGYYAN